MDEIRTFKEFIERPRNKSRKVLNNFNLQKCEISELRKIKSLIITSRDSKIFHNQFKVEMPEPPQFMIEPGQNFSIGYPLQGDIEVLENQEGEEERVSENIAYENTPIEPDSYTEINNYIQIRAFEI